MENFDIIHFIKSQFAVHRRKDPSLKHEFFDRKKREILDTLKMVYPSTEEMDDIRLLALYETARKEYISIIPIDIPPSPLLLKKDIASWLTPERRRSMRRDYTDRYLGLLKLEGRPEKVIAELDRSSEEILEKLGDPQSSRSFYRKGLVVGNVQSGKTGNFNAVINKAIDAGYSLVIVLSGIIEDLRSQTQDRIDNDVRGEGIVDKVSGRKGVRGVGRIRRFGEQGDQQVRQLVSITSTRSDFNRSVKESDFSLNNKNILVCKKNPGVLKNLLIWLSEYLQENTDKHNIPLLVIDDEADNASLNNLGHMGKDFASSINGYIRALLNLFSRKSYLGYTATPFANVLQDRNAVSSVKWRVAYRHNSEYVTKEFDQVDNIFPDDFIMLLVPPSNYIGAKNIFETVLDDSIKKLPLVIEVGDTVTHFPSNLYDQENAGLRPATRAEVEDGVTRASSKYDEYPDELPLSLQEAVLSFIISIAVRMSRKPDMINSRLYNPHHTMLIHVSRFITWQITTKSLISAYVQTVENRLLTELAGKNNSIYREFRQIWNKYFAATMADIRDYLPNDYKDEFLTPRTWDDIEPLLIAAVKGIEVRAINSFTKEKLEYTEDINRNGKKYIAIGGNRLSRGFTLEGLTINYFIRNTDYADTLMQMGRWFGYRPGYIDCCRIFTTPDAVEKFDSTTRSIEELEAEFLKMDREGKTPKDFLLRVRLDPGALKITRPAILKNAKAVYWSYQDKLVQTTKFVLQPQKIGNAWSDFKAFVLKYKAQFSYSRKKQFWLFHTTPDVLFELLNLENSFYGFAGELVQIRRFIEKCQETDKLTRWTIALKAAGDARNVKQSDSDFPFSFPMTQRRGPAPGTISRYDFINKQVFAVSGRSANIVSAGTDLAVLLGDRDMRSAEQEFGRNRIDTLVRKKKITEAEAMAELAGRSVTYPERIYREIIPDQQGLLLIYLQDPIYAFRQDKGASGDPELAELIDKKGFSLNTPLIGMAFGFPPIYPDPGESYAVSKRFDITEDEEEEEFDEELQNEE